MSPSTIVEVVTTPSPRAAVTTIDTAFMVGFAAKGSTTTVIEINSPGDITAKLGARDSTVPWLWDSLDVFFKEGGNHAYVGRRVGPTPVKATRTLNDGAGSPAPTVKVTAKTVGTDGNLVAVAVGSGTLTVYYNDVVVETFTGLSTRAAYIAVVSDYVDVTATGSSSLVPATLAKSSLSTGVDDHANSTTTELSASLGLFVADLGPGQVLAPGVTDDSSHALIAAHADTFDRIALLDAPNTATVATVTDAAAAIQGGAYARTAAMFAPWVVVAGPLQGQERTVPPSAVAAGLMAHNDLAGIAPDEPAANTHGDSATATDLSVTTWTDANRETLNAAGVDAFKSRRGTITLWGYRTLYNPATDEKWVELGAARVLMQIIAELEAASEPFVLRRMDGKRHLLVEYANTHIGVLQKHYDAGSLADAVDSNEVAIPGTAYSVSAAWNATTREMSDEVRLRISGMVEDVLVNLIRRAAGESL